MSPDAGKFRVLTANGDGTSELDVCGWTHVGIPGGRRLVARRQTNRLCNPWHRTVHWVVIQIQDVASGKVKTLSRFNNVQLNDLAWLPDSRGLLATYQPNATLYARSQIALVSEPAGQFRPITRDTNNYQTITVSADGKTLATVRAKGYANVLPVACRWIHRESSESCAGADQGCDFF